MSAAARSVADALLRRSSPPPLSPKKPYDSALSPRIEGLSDPLPLKAALFLCNDDITAAHETAQSCEGDPVADHVHQQVHRSVLARNFFGRSLLTDPRPLLQKRR